MLCTKQMSAGIITTRLHFLCAVHHLQHLSRLLLARKLNIFNFASSKSLLSECWDFAFYRCGKGWVGDFSIFILYCSIGIAPFCSTVLQCVFKNISQNKFSFLTSVCNLQLLQKQSEVL